MSYTKKFMNTCLRILDSMVDGYGYPAKLAEKLNMSRQNMNRYWKVLKREGVVSEVSVDLWRVNKKERYDFFNKELHSVEKDSSDDISRARDTIRAHGFQIKLPYNFRWSANDRLKFVKRIRKNFVSVGQGQVSDDDWWFCGNGSTWVGQGFQLNNWKIHLTTKSFIFIMSDNVSLFSQSGQAAYLEAFNMVKHEVVKPLEQLLGRRIGDQGKYGFKVSRHHYALIKNLLAQDYNKKKLDFAVYAEDGTIFALIDSSYADELEFIHRDTGTTDVDRHKNLLNSNRDTNLDFYKIQNFMGETAELINGTAKMQKFYGENIVSHINVNNRIADGVENMNQMNRELVDTMKGLKNVVAASKPSVVDPIIDIPSQRLPDLDVVKSKIKSFSDIFSLQAEIASLSEDDRFILSIWISETFGGDAS